MGGGVQNSKTGVAINILTSVFLHPGWKDMGVKVNNHRQIIAERSILLQSQNEKDILYNKKGCFVENKRLFDAPKCLSVVVVSCR